jgi:DHA1 family tetracycline resistance protein-like MFS transporter
MSLNILRSKLASLLLITFLDTFSLNIITPAVVFVFFDANSSLFPINTSQAIRSHWYGVAISLPYFAAMLATPILTSLSDRYGRKIMLLVASLGAMIFALCSGSSILLGMIGVMLVGKFTGGLCARSEPTALAALNDFSPPHRKAINIGLLQATIAFAAFSGPVLGGYVTQWHFNQLNYSAAFWLAAIVAFLSIGAVALFKETYQPVVENRLPLKQQLQQLKAPGLSRPIILMVVFQIAWSAYYQFTPPILKQYYHYSPQAVGWFVGLIALWITIASLYGVRVLKPLIEENTLIKYCGYTMLVGFLLTIISYIAPSNHIDQLLLWSGAVLIPMGDVIAYCLIVAMLSEIMSKAHQGKAMGLCFFLAYSAWGMTALLGGFLAGIHITLPVIIAPMTLLLTCFI